MKNAKLFYAATALLLIFTANFSSVFFDASKDQHGVSAVAQEAITKAEEAIRASFQAILEAKDAGANVAGAEYFIELANSALEMAKSAYEHSDYSKALKLANEAKSLAKKAEKSVANALKGIEESEEDRETAIEALARAEEAVAAAEETIAGAQQVGADATNATLLLDQSNSTRLEAIEALNNDDFELALELAEESRELAEEANDVAERALEDFEEHRLELERESAQEAIDDAEKAINEANEVITSLRASGVNVTIAEGLLTQANSILLNATAAFDEGDYEIAASLAGEADALAERAVEFAESAQSELGVEALQMIVETEEFVQGVKESLESAQSTGVNLTEAARFLNSSLSSLAEARKAFDIGNYTGARALAEEAKQLAERAQSLVEEAVEAVQDETRRVVQEVVEEAEAMLLRFRNKLEESSSKGLNVTLCISVFKAANLTLQLAKHALDGGRFYEAKGLAESVLDLVKNGLDLLTSLSLSPVSGLEASEDEEGNVLVFSSVGNLSMSAKKPSVAFGYRVNETSLDLGLDFLSFSEFVDVNHDNLIQENEILQILRFEDLVWKKTLKVSTVDDNQVISVVYEAKSVYYHVRLEILFFKYPTVFSASVDNTTVVFDVSGAAMGAKINIEVNEWSWLSNKSALGLNVFIDVGTLGMVFENSTFQGNLAQILVNTSNVVIATGWLTKAKLIDPVGGESFARVNVGYTTQEGEGGMTLDVSFIYPNFEGFSMEHDPTIDVRLTPSMVIYVPFFSTVWLSLGSAAVISLIALGILLSGRRKEGVRKVFERMLQERRLSEDANYGASYLVEGNPNLEVKGSVHSDYRVCA